MPQSNDCTNTQTDNGRNLTPVPLVEAAIATLGHIELDPASDELANRSIKAARYYGLEDDGYTKPWQAETVFLNPPGRTTSDRRQITAAQWAGKLAQRWYSGDIAHAVYVCYRGGSLGSLGALLPASLVCLTTNNAESTVINGSGRFAFERVIGGVRSPQPSNTQSSAVLLLSTDEAMRRRFRSAFAPFGVVMAPLSAPAMVEAA